jgi:hypothetical protein
MKRKDRARSPPTTRNIPELGISENKARLALGTEPSGESPTAIANPSRP